MEQSRFFWSGVQPIQCTLTTVYEFKCKMKHEILWYLLYQAFLRTQSVRPAKFIMFQGELIRFHSVVKIPKEVVLSVRTCFLAEHIKFIPYGVGAQLSLSLALYSEMWYTFFWLILTILMADEQLSSLRQDRSKWYGYLQSLPTGLVDLPIFWMKRGDHINCSDADDCEEALLWLTGTEAAKILQSKTDDHCSLLVCTFPSILGHPIQLVINSCWAEEWLICRMEFWMIGPMHYLPNLFWLGALKHSLLYFCHRMK